jgi:hypothetical protein
MVHGGTQVIFEEWDLNGWPTIGSVIAKERGLPWENVGTPDTPEFQTGGKLQCPPVPVVICTYGPIENQTCRERYFLDRIKSIMADRDHGIFVCGLAHIQLWAKSCLTQDALLRLTNGNLIGQALDGGHCCGLLPSCCLVE